MSDGAAPTAPLPPPDQADVCRDGIRPTIASSLVVAAATLVFSSLAYGHGGILFSFGNSEWDYTANILNNHRGVLDRTGSLADAFEPDGLYGPGYPAATFLVRGALRLVGLSIDAFRGAQIVTVASAAATLLATAALARRLGTPRHLEWVAPAAVACVWPFCNLAAQVTTDVLSSALASWAIVLLLGGGVRGCLGAGALVGGAVLVRANNLALLPITLLLVAGTSWVAGAPRRRAPAVAALLAGFVIIALPRMWHDYPATGKLIFTDQGRNLRALLLEGGLDALRPEPITVTEVILSAPGRFVASVARTYVHYMLLLGPGMAAAMLLAAREPHRRSRALVAICLLTLGPIAVSAHPEPAGRYALNQIPLAVAAVSAAVLAQVSERAARWIAAAAGASLVPLFALETALLADKYRYELPLDAIVERCGGEAGGPPPPPVLVRIGGPSRLNGLFGPARHALAPLRERLVQAPHPVNAAFAREFAVAGRVLLLRIPLTDTGPSVLLDRMKGRERDVIRPDADPVLESGRARRLLLDATTGTELFEVTVD